MALLNPLPTMAPAVHAAFSPRARLAGPGPGACSDQELVALMLGGRRSAVLDAGRVMEACGSLAELARAPLDVLQAIVGPNAAASIVAACELGRRAVAARPATGWRIRTPADLAERLAPEMAHLEHEELRVALLNTKNTVIALSTLYVGNLTGTSVRVGEVFRNAVRRQAAAIVVAHNHPSGDPSPSAEDLRITGELGEAGRLLDIELLDHLVIGQARWLSLRALGALGQPPSPGTTIR